MTRPIPQKHQRKPYYHYSEVADYLEEKHKKNFKKFWHYLCTELEAENGTFVYLPEDILLQDEDLPKEIKEIAGYFKEFLGADYNEPIWVEW